MSRKFQFVAHLYHWQLGFKTTTTVMKSKHQNVQTSVIGSVMYVVRVKISKLEPTDVTYPPAGV